MGANETSLWTRLARWGRGLRSILALPWRLGRRLLRAVGWVLYQLIGSWNPPPWLRLLVRLPGLGAGLAARGVRRTHASWPRTVRAGGAVLVVAAVAAGGVGGWYALQPTPVRYTVTAKVPGPTPLEEDARPEPLTLVFGGSVARLEQIGKPVTGGVALEPAVAGAWRWAADRVLLFTPEEDWGVGTAYTVRFERSLFPAHVRLRRYSVDFRTAPFTAEFVEQRFYQNPTDRTERRVVATVGFSHAVDQADFPGRVELLLGEEERPLASEVAFDEFGGRAFIRSEPLLLPPESTPVRVVVDDGARSARGGRPLPDDLATEVVVPGEFDLLRIEDASVALVRNRRDEQEQVLVVETTTGVAPDALQERLRAWVLPEDRPARPGFEAVPDYQWRRVGEIGDDVLAVSEPVTLEPLPSVEPSPARHSFRVRVPEQRTLFVRVDEGLRSPGGYVLPAVHDALVPVPPFPQAVRFVTPGSVLSLSGEKRLSVAATNVPAVIFEVGQVLLTNINHLVTQAAGDLTNPRFINYRFGRDNIAEREVEVRRLGEGAPGRPRYAAFDLAPYLGARGSLKRGLFLLRVQGWDPEQRRTLGPEDRRLVLVTDLGVLVKRAKDGSQHVFVMSIRDGTPVAGARVNVLGLNGLPVVSERTDASGVARLPDLSDFRRERTPTAYVVMHGDDLSFLPYDRFSRQLELTRFDIGGDETPLAGPGDEDASLLQGLEAYLFSDRGIYRPGDRFHVGAIVRAPDWSQRLAGVPLEAVVTDARGLEVARETLRLSPQGFEEIAYRTDPTSPTGTWQVNLYVLKDEERHSLLGSTQVRVEEFLPDRMRITTRLSRTRARGWVKPEGLRGLVTLKNLFGTPAADRRITAELSLSPRWPEFEAWPDYRFTDPLRSERSFQEPLPETRTDARGEAEIPIDLDRFAPATYRLVLSVQGFESEGGRAVTGLASVVVSPLDYLVGFKPDGDLSYVRKGSERSIGLIAIDPRLESTAVSGLTLERIEKRHVSVLTRQDDGTYAYESVAQERLLDEAPLEIPAAGLPYPLDTSAAGDYVLVIADGEGTELSRIEYTVAGAGELARDLERNAELDITLNKRDFAPGERIELQIEAPYVGAGLITIEREGVYAYKWFRTDATRSVQTIRVPETLEGNGYVNVAFVRALTSREIFMSPLSYGVVPFTVARARRTNEITLEAPARARPGEPLVIRYASGEPGRMVVFAVDEGILQVAGYTTPDPLGYFFRKRALEVDTLQILDLILPEFSLVKALSAPGGDLAAAPALRSRLNPFRRKTLEPAAFWSGLLESGPTAREVRYRVPDHFNGTLRVMAVAVSPGTIGVARERTLVQGPFVITPNAPTFLAPGDEAEISVAVANTLEGSGRAVPVRIALEGDERLSLLDGAAREVEIDEGREATVRFRVRAEPDPGAATLTFTAGHGDETARLSLGLSVRPAMPYRVTTRGGYVQQGSAEAPVQRNLYPHLRRLEASASTLPLGVAHGLVGYLDAFPYGCTEQVVSKAFPALVLQRRPVFATSPEKATELLENALRVLQARQNGEGAFGFWAANSYVSDFQTVYALHFLTEVAAQRGSVPGGLLRRGLGYLTALARSPAESLTEARDRAYALYVITRNGRVTSREVAALRERLESDHEGRWERDLTGILLAATYRLLHEDDAAAKLIGGIEPGQEVSPQAGLFYDRLVRDSLLLYVLARHFPERLPGLGGESILSVVEPVLGDRFNTISSALTVLALDAYAKALPEPAPGGFSVAEVLAGGGTRALELPAGLFPSVAFSPEAEAVRFTQEGEPAVFYQVLEAGFKRDLPEAPATEGLEVQREFRDREGEVVSRAGLGDTLEVHLKVRATDGRTHYNVAVDDLLPGGLSVALDSLPRSGRAASAGAGWRPDFVDAREDRVVFFGTVGERVREIVYTVRATSAGSFTVPPPAAASMYERGVSGMGAAGRLVVESAP